jgi:hypothetical protein
MEEAKVSHPPEADGQLMPEQQPEKFPAWQGADLSFSYVVLVAEADLAISVGDDGLLEQHATIVIAAQIEQRLLATANLLAMHYPGIRQWLLAVNACQPQGLKPFGPEHPREI